LEQTDAIAAPLEDVLDVLQRKPDMIAVVMNVFCRALKEAYSQVNTLAVEDTIHRLVKILIGLAAKLGQPSGSLVEIPTYLTQEEIAQMVAARRERISTALNSLRRQGMVHYSARGHLVLNVSALESYCT
jgi:CRP-like cAMP-binding protein